MKKQNIKQKKQSESILEILDKGNKPDIRALFSFNIKEDTEDEVLLKFNLWARYFFINYFKAEDAPFHREMDLYNYKVYSGSLKYFVDIAFRGSSKTTRTKLFVAFCIANDTEHYRRYIKILSEDLNNAKQWVTDVYNMFVSQKIIFYYPEIFQKTDEKREEKMESFTTSFGVKMKASSIGTDQRGQIQEDARPDFEIFDDIETRKTLRSATVTKAIWDNMEEARTGLSKEGGAIYLGNYLSERGNIHRLIDERPNRKVMITPIKKDGKPTWSAYTIDEINKIEQDADDFEGEYLCEPSAGADIFFDREIVKNQETKEPIKTVAGFKIFYKYDPSHRYGSGHDVAGGVGLDHSTSAFIDFSTLPNRVVGTYKNNEIKPDVFGYEIEHQAYNFGKPIVAVENNKFDMTIGVLKQNYDNLYFTEDKQAKVGTSKPRTYGWNTNSMSKPKMLFELKRAVEDGHLLLTDKDVKKELLSYSRDDLMDRDEDPRLTTRHFDLLMAVAIAWQMRNHAEVTKEKPDNVTIHHIPQSEYEGGDAEMEHLPTAPKTDELANW